MDRNAKTPPPVQGPAADEGGPNDDDRGAEASEETVVEHDPTLKWILSDHFDMNVTPPPDADLPSRATPSAQPTPVPVSLRVVKVTTPLREDDGGGHRAGAPTITLPMPTADAYGATPMDFFSADPTPPPPPSGEVPAQSSGAAPATILSGASVSDTDLSADAVELPSSSAEDLESTTSAEARSSVDNALATAAPAPDGAATGAEPAEMEPEALVEVESSEHLMEPFAAPVAPSEGAARTATPPPVRPEAALSSRQPDASPPTKAPPAEATPTAPTTRQPSAAPGPTIVVPSGLFEDAEAAHDGQVPEALARRSLKRSKPWYEEVFDEDYLRTVPFMTASQTAREVDFIRSSLEPPSSAEILDVGCGYGRHALELAQQGFHMTGLDLSLPLLIRAADQAQKRGLTVDFVHADMREMTFAGQFDAAYCVLSSFGYFDEETNLRVASSICKALKPGGRFLLDIINRDYIVGDVPSRVWWEGDGCVVLEEVDFNYHTSRVLIRRSVVFGNGRQIEQELSLRAYSLHELGKLLRQAGLRVLDVSGSLATKSRFFGAASRNIIAVCERPSS